MTPPHNLYLSNSMLRDYEKMCPIEFKAKWFDNNQDYKGGSDAMERGNVFETMVIGLSVNQKPTEPSPKLKASVFYPRIQRQAKVATAWLDSLGGKILSRQQELKGCVTDLQGRSVYIKGGLDIRYGWGEKPHYRQAVIDLKFTGNTENEWSEYAWGDIEHMDLSQAKHYNLLHKLNYPDLEHYGFMYGVFDHSPKEKFAPFNVNISEQAMENHIERCSRAYHAIIASLDTGIWTPVADYDQCRYCKIKCPSEVKFPQTKEVNLK